VTECVPETYQTKRISYRTEQRTENYTAYRCETVQECRQRTVCTTRVVSEWVDQCRKVCVKVPCCEERTVMKPCYRTVCETKYVTKCVDQGHWECREEYSHLKAFCNHLTSLCSSHGSCGCSTGCNTCNTGCNSGCDSCAAPCAPSCMVTRKVWVPCMVQEQCPVTCTRRICEMHAEVVKVQTCRTEYRDETCKVCVKRCVPESHVVNYTVCVTKSVPYQTCRTVCIRVPVEECVTCTRMVRRTVTREVPCETTCGSSCGESHGCGLANWFHGCGSSCNTGCGGGCSLFSGWGSHGCNSGCNTGCGGGLFSGCHLFGGCGASTGCCN
jgi:hypothetical protein